MKDFGEWLSDPARRVTGAALTPEPPPNNPILSARSALEDALDGLDVYISYHIRCCVCGRRFEWPVEIELLELGAKNYCGGSPSCCP